MNYFKIPKQLKSELSATVKDFNQALKHQQSSIIKGKRAYLPNQLKVSSYTKRFTSEAQVKKEIQSLKNYINSEPKFTKVGNSNFEITEWEKNRLNEQVEQININRNNMLEWHNNNNTPHTSEIRLQEMLIEKQQGLKNINAYRNALQIQSAPSYNEKSFDVYKEQYLKNLDTFINRKDLRNLIETVDGATLYEMGLNEEFLHISFTSDPIEENKLYNAIMQKLPDEIRKAYDNNKISDRSLRARVRNNLLTEEQYLQITGKQY